MQRTERPPIERLSNADLLEELCLALRDVGVATSFLAYVSPDSDITRDIHRVRAASNHLEARGIDPAERLAQLTYETHWMMPELRRECLDRTADRPWVRDARDGLRIAMRCTACQRAEFPPDSREIRLCGACLAILEAALASRVARPDMFLYRTYQPSARCLHANEDTVLGVFPWSMEYGEGFTPGLCRQCVRDEVLRRRSR